MYSPYDWNEAIRHRGEYIEERMAEGSPVVGLSCQEGVLLLTVRGTQRKVFEIYDRLAFSAVGLQADIEAVRLSAIDFAHQEGFARSPEDVTIGRVVAAISPALKKAFGDQFSAPLVLRALFAEVGRRPETDSLYILNYDGEFRATRSFAAVAGTSYAEERMAERLAPLWGDGGGAAAPSVENALHAGLRAWAVGKLSPRPAEGDQPPEYQPEAFLRTALETSVVEAALLERQTGRQSRFRELSEEEVQRVVSQLQ
ncbi:MAG: hypothetical protein QHJ73_08770 [Armatimonadota bacterium]|nr:hypothetical protein [Armatimonadota bacterium]